MHHQELATEKYWQATVKSEYKALRREQNAKAIWAFCQFLFVLAVAFGCWYAMQTMPSWLPTVTEFMDKNGVTESLNSFRAWIGSL